MISLNDPDKFKIFADDMIVDESLVFKELYHLELLEFKSKKRSTKRQQDRSEKEAKMSQIMIGKHCSKKEN